MKGVICMWSGAIVDILAGWHLCDGAQGTPDLRDRFIVGAGSSYNPGDTGGADSHSHSFTGDGHTHELSLGAAIAAGAERSETTTVGNAVGTTDPSDHRPRYYSLAFIQKL